MNKMKKKNRAKKQKMLRSEKAHMRRILSVYFSAHILLSAAFGLCAGTYLARRGSEKIRSGTEENCIFMEDLNKWCGDSLGKLYLYYKNKADIIFFENNP